MKITLPQLGVADDPLQGGTLRGDISGKIVFAIEHLLDTNVVIETLLVEDAVDVGLTHIVVAGSQCSFRSSRITSSGSHSATK